MKKDHEHRKARAVLALPLCITVGMLLGVAAGTALANIPIGIALGMSVGSAVGMMVFGALYSKARDDEIREYEEKYIVKNHRAR